MFIGKGKPKGTVSAIVRDKDGKLIADLGMIAGGKLTKEEKRILDGKLAKLKADRVAADKKKLKEARHGG